MTGLDSDKLRYDTASLRDGLTVHPHFVAIALGVWKSRWTLIATTSLGFVLSLAIAMISVPEYRAAVEVLPVVDAMSGGAGSALPAGLGGLAGLIGVDLGDGNSSDEAIAVLRSRSFLSQFLEQSGARNAVVASMTRSGPIGFLFGEKRAPTENDIYEYFSDNVFSVSEDRFTAIITLAIEWDDPQVAASWANGLIQAVNEYLRLRAKQEAEASLEFLRRELESTQAVAIRESIYSLIEAQSNRAMRANVRTEFAFKVIDPAIAPDEDDPVRPRTVVIVFVGLVFGFLAGLLWVALAVTYSSFRTALSRS